MTGSSIDGHWSRPPTTKGSTIYSTQSSQRPGGGGGFGDNANSNNGAGGRPLLPPMASSMDPFIFAAADKEPSSAEIKQEIVEIESERERLGESWDGLELALVEKWRDKVDPETLERLLSAPGEEKGKKRMMGRTNSGEVEKLASPDVDKSMSRAQSILRKTPSLPKLATKGHQRTPSTSSLRGRSSKPTSDRDPSSAPPSRVVVSPSSTSTRLLKSILPQEEVERSRQTFEEELKELRGRRGGTEEKYRARLEYLETRLQGAVLREKLR